MKLHYIHAWAVRRAIKFCNIRFQDQRKYDEKFIKNLFEFAISDESLRQTRHIDAAKSGIVPKA